VFEVRGQVLADSHGGDVRVMEFSVDQSDALAEVFEWRDNCMQRQYFALGGYAGTGKSTLVGHLREVWKHVAIGALAGKAAHVLRQKGCEEAQTLHSLIYECEKVNGRTFWRRKGGLGDVRVVIIDEASMVNRKLMDDLLAFELPVLFVGDHGQLEPIGDNPNLMKHPHFRLEKIHRQAASNPILRLAAAHREGKAVPREWVDPKGRLELRPRKHFEKLVSPDVQIIAGFNKTRHKVNASVRAMLGKGGLVQAGDLLIVLRNSSEHNIYNGQQVRVRDVVGIGDGRTIAMEIECEDGRPLYVEALREQFGSDLPRDFQPPKGAVLLDYGYCLTAHKAQGSEWDSGLVLEEVGSSWDARRWRYTVDTRFKERLVYCA
jgi:exodeoxyribonuclease-5